MIVHFASSPGTTGIHLGEAALAAGVGWPLPKQPGHHVFINEHNCEDDYLWVEAGNSSFPMDSGVAGCTTAGYLIDVHLHLRLSLLQATLFDTVFIAQKDYLPYFQASHPNVHWLPLAAPKPLTQLTRGKVFDIGFVGQSTRFRELLMNRLSGTFKINDWRRHHTLEELGKVYSQSRIVINPAINRDVNMRFFEGMACGALVLTSSLANGVEELTSGRKLFLTADLQNLSSLVELISDLLKSAKPEEIGRAGREWVMEGHTYDHRLAKVLSIMEKAPREGPLRKASPSERQNHLLRLAAEQADVSLAAAVTRNQPMSLRGTGLWGLTLLHRSWSQMKRRVIKR